jgi:hypothetical protein
VRGRNLGQYELDDEAELGQRLDQLVVGSGQGSVPTRDILTEQPALAAQISEGTFDIGARPVPLNTVEQTWTAPATSQDRLVLVP